MCEDHPVWTDHGVLDARNIWRESQINVIHLPSAASEIGFKGGAKSYSYISIERWNYTQAGNRIKCTATQCTKIEKHPFIAEIINHNGNKDGFGWRRLRWFPHNIRAIIAKINLPKKPHGMVIFLKKVRLLKLPRWPQERKLNLKLYIFQLKQTFRASWRHNNTGMKHSVNKVFHPR